MTTAQAVNTQCRRVWTGSLAKHLRPGAWVDYGEMDLSTAAERHAERFDELFVSVEVRDESTPGQTQIIKIEKDAR